MEVVVIAILRSLERILSVLFGGLLIYLGYKLFIKVPTKEDSEGKFRLPGGWGIHLTRVGPGVFFSLFGAAILIMSFRSPITYDDLVRGIKFIGASPGQTVQVDKETLDRHRTVRKNDINLLNKMADPNSEPLNPVDVQLSIIRIKLDIMRFIWDEEWGIYNDFKKWINETGGEGDVPDKYKAALEYFNQ